MARVVDPSCDRASAFAYAAALLTLYGLVLTSVGLLVQADVIHRSDHADQKALAWQAFLWDPWFLLWGLLIIVALRRQRIVPEPRP